MDIYSSISVAVLVVFVYLLYPYLAIFSYLFLWVVIAYLFLIAVCDGDVVLMLYERFGSKGEHLKGQVVWITGASSGIGEEVAVMLAKKGCKLVLSARREGELQRVKERCLQAGPGLEDRDVLTMVMDACKFESHKDCVHKVIKHFQQVDILINNSGRSQRSEAVEAELETDMLILHLNLLGAISVTKCLLPFMIRRRHGQIINVSSIAGKIGAPCSTTYAASKHGMMGYFETLRTEVYHDNIRISNVCPGPVASNIIENAVQKDFAQEPCKNYDGFAERSWAVLQTSERCAELILVAISNQIGEAWIGKPAMLIQFYMVQYTPLLYRHLAQRFGIKRITAFRRSQMKYLSDEKAYYK